MKYPYSYLEMKFNILVLQIWAFFPSLIIFIIFLALSTLFTFFIYYTNFGQNATDIYLTVLILSSGGILIITLILGKKLTTMTAGSMKADRLLMYNTIFISFWLIFSRIINIYRTNLTSPEETSEMTTLILYNLTNFCGLCSNPIGLLFLLYLSSPLREEFCQTFCCSQTSETKVIPIRSADTIFLT